MTLGSSTVYRLHIAALERTSLLLLLKIIIIRLVYRLVHFQRGKNCLTGFYFDLKTNPCIAILHWVLMTEELPNQGQQDRSGGFLRQWHYVFLL